jgi:anaerobic magnesium-protoporphyrin IX monomethyl ester cyclase
VEQIYETSRRLHEAGIQVGFFLQFGYPGETREDIEKTFRMVRECQPDDIGVSVSYPMPGTKFYELVRQQLGAKQNWDDSNDLAMLYQGPFCTAFYRQLHRVLHREFRARKHRTELNALVRQRGRVRTKHLKHAAFLVYAKLTLPLERWKLNRLENAPHQGLPAIAPQLTNHQAAIPSPQTEA